MTGRLAEPGRSARLGGLGGWGRRARAPRIAGRSLRAEWLGDHRASIRSWRRVIDAGGTGGLSCDPSSPARLEIRSQHEPDTSTSPQPEHRLLRERALPPHLEPIGPVFAHRPGGTARAGRRQETGYRPSQPPRRLPSPSSRRRRTSSRSRSSGRPSATGISIPSSAGSTGRPSMTSYGPGSSVPGPWPRPAP